MSLTLILQSRCFRAAECGVKPNQLGLPIIQPIINLCEVTLISLIVGIFIFWMGEVVCVSENVIPLCLRC